MAVSKPLSAAFLLGRERIARKHRLSLFQPRSNKHVRSETLDFELGLGITEIVGEGGCGKTQFLLSLCICSASHLLESSMQVPYGKALFVSLGNGTTKAAIAKRLSQMAASRKIEGATVTNEAIASILERILVRFIRNEDEFSVFLFEELPQLLRGDETISLLAMDGVASMFRHSDPDDPINVPQRSALLFRVASHLKEQSEKHDLPVVVTNQVTADFSQSRRGNLPALGLSWAHCVTESWVVSRQEAFSSPALSQGKGSKLEKHGSSRFHRTIQSIRSPIRKMSWTSFLIDDEGPFPVRESRFHTYIN